MLNKNSPICTILQSQQEIDMFNSVLSTHGYRRITSFTSAKEAYEVAIRQQFELFITRMEMPEMSGVVFIQKIRATGNYGLETHLFISDMLNTGILNILYEYDINYVLSKPFTKQTITAKFSHLLNIEGNLPPIEARYREARTALFNNITEMAEIIALDLYKQEPDSEQILLLLGQIEEKKKNLPAAINFYRLAREKKPTSAIAPHKLAHALIKTGQNQEAADLLEVAALLNPYNIKLLENAGLSNYNICNYDKAEAYAKQLKDLDSENKEAGEIQANAQIALGKYSEVVNSLKNSHDERELIAFLNNAGIKLAQGDDAEGALNMYKACANNLQNSKYLYAIYYNMGVAYRKMGDLSNAIANYEYSLELKPDFDKAKTALAEIREKQKKVYSQT